MKRSKWKFGSAIFAFVLIGAGIVAAEEIAPPAAVPPPAFDPAPPPPAVSPPGGRPQMPYSAPLPPRPSYRPPATGAPPTSAPRPGARPPMPSAAPLPAPAPGAPPTAVPPRPSPQAVSPASGGGFFVKFNNADLYEVIHTLGRTAGINYLIDPRVRGVVNVHTQGMLQKSSALDLLFAILRVNGATAIKEGDTYHIIPMAEAKMEPVMPSFPGDNTSRGAVSQVAMRAYPLQHISVAEMAKVIRPFLSPGGDAVEVGRANILLVIDTEGNLAKTARLIELFDSDVFRSSGMKLFRLKVLDPEEMAKNLENIFGALDFSSRGGKPSGINLVPITRLNSLLVVSASPKTMEDVERWIEELDRPGGSASRSVYRYRVKFGKVTDIALILEKLYPARTAPPAGKKTEFKPEVSQLPGQPSFSLKGATAGQGAAQPAKAAAAAAKTGRGEAEADAQPFDIIPDESTNSLIIRASLSEYADALGILKTIDVYPQQVLLEVLVGEVNLEDDLKLGINWQWTNPGGEYRQTATLSPAAALATNNLSYLIEKTGRISAAFKALAENGRASILSSPSVIATNGKKSKINVVDQIPITTSVLNSATNPPVTTTTVEYRDVGVILSFTPFINDDGLVTMEIDQEVSDVNTVASGANPTFFKRSITTNLVASQDQSIVLGGLVKERKSLDRTGVPFFYKIPLLGWLFGSRSDNVSRNELLIFITPRVIRNVAEGVQLSRDFEERVAQLKARMVEAQGLRLKAKEDAPAPKPAGRAPADMLSP